MSKGRSNWGAAASFFSSPSLFQRQSIPGVRKSHMQRNSSAGNATKKLLVVITHVFCLVIWEFLMDGIFIGLQGKKSPPLENL